MKKILNDNILSDHELKLKAVGVNFSIFIASDFITKLIQEQIKEFNNLKQEDINKLFFIVSYSLLFQTQKIIWERFPIENKENSLTFEEYLFQMFEKTIGVNPRPFIKDIVDYVMSGDPSREAQFIGNKICKEFNKIDAILMFEICTLYNSFLIKGGFFESVKKSWELPNEKLEEMLIRVESDNNIEN